MQLPTRLHKWTRSYNRPWTAVRESLLFKGAHGPHLSRSMVSVLPTSHACHIVQEDGPRLGSNHSIEMALIELDWRDVRWTLTHAASPTAAFGRDLRRRTPPLTLGRAALGSTNMTSACTSWLVEKPVGVQSAVMEVVAAQSNENRRNANRSRKVPHTMVARKR